MAKLLVDDALWELIEPHLPRRKPQRTGRPRLSDRAALTGIIFVLHTGMPWAYLPKEMGCGSGVSCWRRLRDWQAAGAWKKIHHALLTELHQAGEIDWSRAVIDSSSIRAVKGGSKRGRIPPTAPARAASITSSPKRRGSRWWSRSLLRMITTLPSSSHSSTRSRPSRASAGDRASDRLARRGIGRTTLDRTRPR